LQKFTENCSPDELRKDITWLVLNWLISHVQVEDKKLAGYLRICSAP
jgi:hemerythrin